MSNGVNKQISTGAGIAAVVVAAIIVSVIMWFALMPKAQTPGQIIPAAQTLSQSSMKGQVQNQTPEQAKASENMSTYKNDRYGFMFQYPKDLIAEENKEVDNFLLDIKESNVPDPTSTDLPLDIDIEIKKTSYKNTSDWFNAMKKDFEKPSNYEGIIIHPKIQSVSDIMVNGVAAKRYVPGGGIFPFNNVCVGFIRNDFKYNICYGGGVKQADYSAAKIGIDQYGQNKYDEKKIEEARAKYQKLFDDIVGTIKFKS
jgi:hypothetical protein